MNDPVPGQVSASTISGNASSSPAPAAPAPAAPASEKTSKQTVSSTPDLLAPKPAAAAVVTPTALKGGLDGIYGQRLVGWARNPSKPDQKLEVEISLDGKPAGTVRAERSRPDFLKADGLPELCGFEFSLPHVVFDDKEHHMTVAIVGEKDERTFIGELTRALKGTGMVPERTRPVQGHVDGFRGLFVTGWTFDPEHPESPVTVELVVDEKPLARTQAQQFRPDLLESGIGDGRCAFGLRVPPELFDGRRHELTVRECTTGKPLSGSQPVIPAMEVRGHIEGLRGSAIAGWVHEEGVDYGHALDLWVDGEMVSSGDANTPRDGGPGHRFHLPLPDRFLNGRPHEIVITLRDHPGRQVAADMLFLPFHLTPEDALQKYAGTRYLRSYLSALGPQRYESLREGLTVLADAASKATTPQELQSIGLAVINMAKGQDQVIRSFTAPAQNYLPIEFPKHDAPKVSIVIPVHNKFATTYNCLASIAGAPCKASFEVVVVDDGSKDETLKIKDIVKNLTVVRHEVAQGFVGASNAGGAAARGEYVVMLNNDTEVMSGWLDNLLDPFTRFEDVGMTGAKLIYPNGSLQEAGGLVWGSGEPWNIGRNGNASDPRYCYVRQADYLSGACLMLPMPLWKELKGFDFHFAPAYYEDTDLAFRVRAKGLKTVYTPFCEVVHYEGVSNGTSTSGSGLKRYQAINQPKFLRRWAQAYRHNGVIGRDAPHVMQDRGTQYRVLVLDAQTLTPDLDAGSYSATQEIRILQSLGFKVTFVPANMAYMGGYTEALQRMGVEVLYAPFYFSMTEVIDRRGSEFDLFYIARYGVADQVLDHIRSSHPQAKIVLNIHDLHFLREVREALQSNSEEHMQHAIATRDVELAVMRKVNLVLSYSEVEQAVIISHNLTSTRTHICPWVVETAAEVPAFAARKGIAFLGGFGHRPNVEAVEWFTREVMPLLRDLLPGVPFLIYGSKAPDSLKSLVTDDVILKGFAKTTEEVYDNARIFVAPLLTGAGLKGKVIGAFSRGIPTVMTPTAAEGTGARHGLDAMVCSNPRDWAEHIASLYQDEVRWTAMSQSCRNLTREQYSFEHGRETIADALHQVGIFPASEQQSLWPLRIEA